MAFSLHQRPKSPFWYASFRTPDPKNPGKTRQHFVSTRKKTKREAQEEAPKLRAAYLAKAGAGDNKSREIFDLLATAAKTAANGTLNFAQGQEILSKMLEISTGKGITSYTVREWFAGWLADKEKTNARGTFLRYKGVTEEFLAFLPGADESLMALTPEDIRAFRDAELASGKSPNTVNDAVKTIRTALNKARRSQVILFNPADAVETLKEEETEKAVFSPANIQKLLSISEDHWKGVILFGYYTGANLRDITNLAWNQVDLAAGTVSYTRRKTGKAITLPIHSELSDWLLTQAAPDNPKAPVFPTLFGKSTAGKSGLSMKFGRLMKKAGLAGEAIKPNAGDNGEKSKGRTRNTLTFHSLRHSFNSAMANAGVLQEVRQKLTGHASAQMNARYTHHELETLKAAIDAVPSLEKLTEEE